MNFRTLPLCLIAGVICGAALPAEVSPRSYVFWPEVSKPAPAEESLYQLPTVQARLLEQVSAERREVVLRQRLGDKLLSVFGSPQTDLVTVRLSGTLVASIVTGIKPANEPFVDFFVTKTIDCLRALESGREAEEFTHFLLDPGQGARSPDGLMTVVDRYRPTAARMLAAFKRNRCEEPKNNVTVAPLHRSQIRVAVRDMLLGEKDVVHFSDADLFVAGQVYDELYFDVAGFYAVRGTGLLRST